MRTRALIVFSSSRVSELEARLFYTPHPPWGNTERFVRGSRTDALGAARSTSFSAGGAGAPLLEASGRDAWVGALARGRGGCPRPARPRSDFGKRSAVR